MSRKYFAIMLLLLFLIPLCSTASAAYTAGETVTVRYPKSGMALVLLETPKYVRWTLKDPTGTVIYETDHEFIYVHDRGYGLGWDCYDEHYLTIPGFPMDGTWTIEGRPFTELLGVIERPGTFAVEYTFAVESGTLVSNLLAPYYMTFDTGITGGRFNLVLPVHPILIAPPLIVFIVVAFMIFTRRRATIIVMDNTKKKR